VPTLELLGFKIISQWGVRVRWLGRDPYVEIAHECQDGWATFPWDKPTPPEHCVLCGGTPQGFDELLLWFWAPYNRATRR
jgi:hypothetical protein